MDGLITSAKDDTSKLEQISNQLDSVRKGFTVSSLSPDAQAQLRSLLAVSDHANDLIVQQRILATLRFDGMYQRYEDVAEAHSETFAWIFNDKAGTETPSYAGSDADGPPLDDKKVVIINKKVDDRDGASTRPSTPIASDDAPKDEIKGIGRVGSWATTDDTATPLDRVPPPSTVAVIDQTKANAKESLDTWLSSGNGIFHISGKLGSGKSTLMKFLCDHELAKTKLEEWAGWCASSQLVGVIMTKVTDLDSSPTACFCQLLLLAARLCFTKVAHRAIPISSPRCPTNVPRTHSCCSSRSLGTGEIDALASYERCPVVGEGGPAGVFPSNI